MSEAKTPQNVRSAGFLIWVERVLPPGASGTPVRCPLQGEQAFGPAKPGPVVLSRRRSPNSIKQRFVRSPSRPVARTWKTASRLAFSISHSDIPNRRRTLFFAWCSWSRPINYRNARFRSSSICRPHDPIAPCVHLVDYRRVPARDQTAGLLAVRIDLLPEKLLRIRRRIGSS